MRGMDWTAFFSLFLVLVSQLVLQASANAEGDALNAFKTNLTDPNNVLQSWDPTLVNPCTWLHITCNMDNSVTRVDLGNANLTGELVPQLVHLVNLQYLADYVNDVSNSISYQVPSRELSNNNISGPIPKELGNLTSLVSLDLFSNRLSGPIPDTLGKLQKLRFLRLNNNNLSGNIPMSLTTIKSLQIVDMSNNMLTGAIPVNGSFSQFTPLSFAGNNLDYPPVSSPPTNAPSPSPSPSPSCI